MADETKEAASEKTVVIGSGAAMSASGGHAVVIAQPRPVAPPILPKVSRRGVVIVGFWSALGLMLAGIGYTIVDMLYPRGIIPFEREIVVGTVDSLVPGKPVKIVDAKTWLVMMDAETARRNNGQEGAILALYQKCPHLGCSVPWREDVTREDERSGESYTGWFLCPCHGSTYSAAGVYVFGPAPRSMDTFLVTITDGKITVNTGKRTAGTTSNGARGVLPG